MKKKYLCSPFKLSKARCVPVTGSSAFMIFSKQFSTYTQSTLMRLKSVFEITSFAPLPPRSRNKEQYLGDFLQTL